nr:type II toxin-antitoxin system YafQ family toxin [Helicobacter rodentium]
MPQEANDHALKGTWLGFREFHIGGDTLVIYKIYDDNTLKLIRLGSHSQLF